MELPPKKKRKIIMERPPSIPEAAWTTMAPELRANVVAAIQAAVKQNEDAVTKEVTKQVTKKVREELKLSNLMQLGGPEADSAKALSKAATLDMHSIDDIVQRLTALETQIQDRATRAEEESKRVYRDLVQAIDQRLENLLGVINLSRDLQIDAVHETITKLEGFRDRIARAEAVAQTTLVNKNFAMSEAQVG